MRRDKKPPENMRIVAGDGAGRPNPNAGVDLQQLQGARQQQLAQQVGGLAGNYLRFAEIVLTLDRILLENGDLKLGSENVIAHIEGVLEDAADLAERFNDMVVNRFHQRQLRFGGPLRSLDSIDPQTNEPAGEIRFDTSKELVEQLDALPTDVRQRLHGRLCEVIRDTITSNTPDNEESDDA